MNDKTRNVVFSSSKNDWNTPSVILDSVYKVLGEVDLDPCTNADWFFEPNIEHNVIAREHFCFRIDGLKQVWNGKTFMNSPYGKATIEWVTKLHDSYVAGTVTEAICVIASRTETQWFNILSPHYIRCEPQVRLHFGNSINSAPFPSSIFYLGKNPLAFIDEFKKYGNIIGCICPTTFRRGCKK